MNTTKKYFPEIRERAVRLFYDQQQNYESQWAAIISIASNIGCNAETLRTWIRQSEVGQGKGGGLTSAEQVRLK